jgi:hypothetical protein
LHKIELKFSIKEVNYLPDSLKDGAIIHGLFFEGCSIDLNGKLVE